MSKHSGNGARGEHEMLARMEWYAISVRSDREPFLEPDRSPRSLPHDDEGSKGGQDALLE